jgi:2,3-bisphosphoglycerate-independent phosphoglycerate mutase
VEEVLSRIGQEIGRKYGVEVIYKSTVEHRGVLVLRGPVSHRVSDTDPHKVGAKLLRSEPLENSKEAALTAEAVNELTRRFSEAAKELEVNKARKMEGRLPINAILLRGGGYMPQIEPIREKYNVRAAAIAGVALIRGVARAVGMDVYTAPGLGGTKDDVFDEAVKLAVELMAKYDLVFLHVKGTDSTSHDGDFDGKVSVVERLDKALAPYLDKLLNNYVVVTSDHATPVAIKEHTGEPVPVMLYGPDVVTDDVAKFSELTCWRGALGRIRGIDIMPTLGSYLGVAEKFGE